MSMSRGEPKLPPNPAVAYVRMSARRREWSADQQMAVVRRYAKRHGIKILRERSDGDAYGKGRDAA
jgi:hypothetical protein